MNEPGLVSLAVRRAPCELNLQLGALRPMLGLFLEPMNSSVVFFIGVVYKVMRIEEEWKNSLLSAARGLSPLPHKNYIRWA
jgi:hypothetical protein